MAADWPVLHGSSGHFVLNRYGICRLNADAQLIPKCVFCQDVSMDFSKIAFLCLLRHLFIGRLVQPTKFASVDKLFAHLTGTRVRIDGIRYQSL